MEFQIGWFDSPVGCAKMAQTLPDAFSESSGMGPELQLPDGAPPELPNGDRNAPPSLSAYFAPGFHAFKLLLGICCRRTPGVCAYTIHASPPLPSCPLLQHLGRDALLRRRNAIAAAGFLKVTPD